MARAMGVIPAPRDIEAVPTTLARIEGTVNMVAHDIAGLMGRMERAEGDVRRLDNRTQRLEINAENAISNARAAFGRGSRITTALMVVLAAGSLTIQMLYS